MKKIIITGGPTNEPIDEVMKITNMSTGSLSTKLGALFLEAGYKVCLIMNRAVNTKEVEELAEAAENLTIISIETTDEMLSALEDESKNGQADALIHAAAVSVTRQTIHSCLKILPSISGRKSKAAEYRAKRHSLPRLKMAVSII